MDHVADLIVKSVIETIKKKNKGGINIKPFQVNILYISFYSPKAREFDRI